VEAVVVGFLLQRLGGCVARVERNSHATIEEPLNTIMKGYYQAYER